MPNERLSFVMTLQQVSDPTIRRGVDTMRTEHPCAVGEQPLSRTQIKGSLSHFAEVKPRAHIAVPSRKHVSG
jgi:hypothetical protein